MIRKYFAGHQVQDNFEQIFSHQGLVTLLCEKGVKISEATIFYKTWKFNTNSHLNINKCSNVAFAFTFSDFLQSFELFYIFEFRRVDYVEFEVRQIIQDTSFNCSKLNDTFHLILLKSLYLYRTPPWAGEDASKPSQLSDTILLSCRWRNEKCFLKSQHRKSSNGCK